jgi:hypothetical protein
MEVSPVFSGCGGALQNHGNFCSNALDTKPKLAIWSVSTSRIASETGWRE